MRMNKKLIKAGLEYLIKQGKETFIDRLTIFLKDKPGLLDFLFDGSLPINDIIGLKIVKHIESTLPCKDYFKGIVSIDVCFDYSYRQNYEVKYKVSKFFDAERRPYGGLEVPDNDHPVEIVVINELQINTTDLNMQD